MRNGKREVDETDQFKKLSIETSHPLWIIKMLSKQYDFETAKKICQHNNTISGLRFITPKPLHGASNKILSNIAFGY